MASYDEFEYEDQIDKYYNKWLNAKARADRLENGPGGIMEMKQTIADKEAENAGNEHAARLSTNREYDAAEQPPAGQLFGNEYNKGLLKYLAGVADSRPSMEVHPSAPLFSWLQMEDIEPGEPMQDTSDFNAQFNTPKPVTKGDNKEPVDNHYVNSKGTMSCNIKTYMFVDKK